MKTYCKLLATSWMVLRPLCPNVHADIHADNINWEKISHFFNFDTIVEEEKQANLKTNIRLLVEEQLKLPSGKNLWKAFQFWENQHPELGFQFEFTLSPGIGAEVVLKGLKNSSENKQIFCFEITINKVFLGKIEADRILRENMLYRPCLIKLIDPDNPTKLEYHLREQKLPFLVTLAHEFLHVLNQLECIDWLKSRGEDFSNLKDKLQEFLIEKLELQNNIGILGKKYKKLWKNKGFDDSLDEMTVILGYEREIEKDLFKFIGETTFLREYSDDKSIISWSHYPFYSHIVLENIDVLLKKTYIEKVLKVFKDLKSKPQKYNYPNIRNHYSSCWPELYLQKHKEYFSRWFLQTVKNCQYQSKNVKMFINFKDLGTFEFVVTPNQVILFGKKDIATYAENCSWGSFSVIDNKKLKTDCINSAYIAIDQYFKHNILIENAGHSQSTSSMLPPPPLFQYGIWQKLSMKIYDGTSDLKFWDNGLNGIIGFEKLKYVADKIEKDFLIIFQKPNRQLRYLKINSKNFETQTINEFDIENLFNNNVNAIKIYYNGVYYQPIIKINK